GSVTSGITHEIKSALTLWKQESGADLTLLSGAGNVARVAADERSGRVWTRDSPTFDAVQLGARQLDEPGRMLRQERPLGRVGAEPVSLLLPRADDVVVRHGCLPRPSIPLNWRVARRGRGDHAGDLGPGLPREARRRSGGASGPGRSGPRRSPVALR